MDKKSIEKKFSSDIDAYFNRIEEKNKSKDKEYNELLELGKILADEDFSENSDKKAVFNKTIKNINKGENIMKKSNKNRRFATAVASLAAVCVMSVGLMQTSFAQELAEKIKNSISLQHVTVSQYAGEHSIEEPIPDELKGKIFDKDGNVLEVLSEEYHGGLYTADGEKAFIDYDGDKAILSTQVEEEKMVIKDSNELNKYTCFDVKLPTYLPEGYKFDRAEFIKDENGDIIDSFNTLIFTNDKTGKNIYMHQRVVEKVGGYETGIEGEIKAVKINGIDAVIYDSNIDWEMDGIIYGIHGRKAGITESKLIKIAESIK